MIPNDATRTRLGQILEPAVFPITVYTTGVDSTAALPCVVIGMPRWEPDTQPCMDTYTWPIAVAVPRPGPDSIPIIELDRLWPIVAETLRTALRFDQTLDGLCKAATVIRSEPGFLSIQGSEVPAQTITIELYG